MLEKMQRKGNPLTLLVGMHSGAVWRIVWKLLKTLKTVSDFIFGGSKITADGDCSYKIKRCLLLGRKVMTNLDSILKS